VTDPRLGSLTAWYQPIVDLNTGRVVGFEALSRIVGPDGAVQSAGELMAELEKDPEAQYELIHRLLAAIRREIVPVFGRHSGFYVSVNVPPSVMGTGRIEPMIRELGLDQWLNRLVVELTERQALLELGRASIDAARALGVTVALDDFGTGHSGLSQVVGLDLDVLKIDRSLLVSTTRRRRACFAGSWASPPPSACGRSPRESRAGRRPSSCARPAWTAARASTGARPSRVPRWSRYSGAGSPRR
jgi:EAL domain-containing protein (putative c-di-GMP-specific phosphodiesterase class I)